MKMAVDASNIRAGGGITHLVELLRSADPKSYGFSKVIVWSGSTTLNKIEDRLWLEKRNLNLYDKNSFSRFLWQKYMLDALIKKNHCNVLFVPGGTYHGNFHPFVTMNQNLLPFELHELIRYGLSSSTLRLLLLRKVQSRSMVKSDGTIFLTHYSMNVVQQVTGIITGKTKIIPHGIDRRFFQKPRLQQTIHHYSNSRPIKILYVSSVMPYKHQWHVIKAVRILRDNNYPVVLDLIGEEGKAIHILKRAILENDPQGIFINYLGSVPYEQLHMYYTQADLCVFASSCETISNILLEGMASGLPIACSNLGPMSEVLGDAGIYFDPENPNDIVRALRELIVNPQLREKNANLGYERAHSYSWVRCANETLSFLRTCSYGKR